MTCVRILMSALIVASLSIARIAEAQEEDPPPDPAATETPTATPMATATPAPAPMMTPVPAAPPQPMAATESRARRKSKNPERTDVVFLNPFYFLIRAVNGGYERVVSPRTSVAIGGTVIDYNGLNVDAGSEDADLRGYGAYVQPHVYFGRRGAPRGPYLAPFISGERLEYDFDTREDVAATRFGVGSTIGWSWLPWDRVNFKLGLGAVYYLVSTTEDSAVTNSGDDVGVTGDLKIGWAF